MRRSRLLGLLIGIALAAASARSEGQTAPMLNETLAWLQKLPTMSRSAIGPKAERDCFQKLTAKDLAALKELHLGGHLVMEGKLQSGHLELPADDFRMLTSLPALEKLDLMENGLSDLALVHIGKIGTLTSLTFGDHAITDGGLKHLAGLKKLTYLNLCFPDAKHGGSITDKGLEDLAGLTALETLDLRATQITDAGLSKLQSLPKLQTLELGNTAVTDQGLRALQAFRSLRRINLLNCKGVTAAGLAELKKALPNCQVVQERPQ
jgi:Leucine Rich repeat